MTFTQEAQRRISTFNEQDIANILYGLATIGYTENVALLCGLAQEATHRYKNFNALSRVGGPQVRQTLRESGGACDAAARFMERYGSTHSAIRIPLITALQTSTDRLTHQSSRSPSPDPPRATPREHLVGAIDASHPSRRAARSVRASRRRQDGDLQGSGAHEPRVRVLERGVLSIIPREPEWVVGGVRFGVKGD